MPVNFPYSINYYYSGNNSYNKYNSNKIHPNIILTINIFKER